MASNRDLCEMAKRITGMMAQAEQYRVLARPLSLASAARVELMRQASMIDDDICSECGELRRLAREPYGATLAQAEG